MPAFLKRQAKPGELIKAPLVDATWEPLEIKKDPYERKKQ